MSRPLPPASVLRRLAGLAALKSEQALATLAATARSRTALRVALDGLDPIEAPLSQPAAGRPADDTAAGGGRNPSGAANPSPHLVRVRLAHRAWVEAQRAELLARLARIEADWQRLLPPAATAFGRARVLDDLSVAAEAAERQLRLLHQAAPVHSAVRPRPAEAATMEVPRP